MRTRTFNKNKINVVTLGCSKNLYDSEVLISQLKANNKNVVHEGDGNIVVINTCGFIDNAKQQSIDTILEYSDKKNQGKIDKLYVTGCLSERYKDDLEKEFYYDRPRDTDLRGDIPVVTPNISVASAPRPEIKTPPLPPQPAPVAPQTVANVVPQTGLTATETALLSPDEQAIRLKQRGIA